MINRTLPVVSTMTLFGLNIGYRPARARPIVSPNENMVIIRILNHAFVLELPSRKSNFVDNKVPGYHRNVIANTMVACIAKNNTFCIFGAMVIPGQVVYHWPCYHKLRKMVSCLYVEGI